MLALPMLGRPRRHGGSGLSDKERAAFAESIKQLVATGRVWCVATLRADLYELLLNEPVLKALKEAGASLNVGPPGAAQLAEINRAPAEAAGTGTKGIPRMASSTSDCSPTPRAPTAWRSCNSRCGSSTITAQRPAAQPS
jgi:hypothetical protein